MTTPHSEYLLINEHSYDTKSFLLEQSMLVPVDKGLVCVGKTSIILENISKLL